MYSITSCLRQWYEALNLVPDVTGDRNVKDWFVLFGYDPGWLEVLRSSFVNRFRLEVVCLSVVG
jgi:hypothetical protein